MKMKLKYLILISGSIVISESLLAQQYYTFEEACRMAGNTTGACAPKSQQEPELDCKKLAGNAFHSEKMLNGGCKKKVTLSPVIDDEIFVEMIGLSNISQINDLKLTIGRSVGLKNAVASFYDGLPIIVFDPRWARAATPETYLVLGHEAGHHFCGHSLEGDPITQKKRELEADRFSGAAIKRFEEYHGKPFLQGALKAAAKLYAGPETGSHPSLEARISAIRLGYDSGSPCGNLAPGIQGYSDGQEFGTPEAE